MNKNDIRYEDELFIKKYITLWAYGYLNGYGQSEGMYSCISRMVSLLKIAPGFVLDIGCGIGRSSFDAANLYHESEIIGIDSSKAMIEYAQKINSSFFANKLIDLPDIHLFNLIAPSFNYSNVHFINAAFEDFCQMNTSKYNLILNVNYLDRCLDIRNNIKSMYSLLCSGGHVIGSTPLNFKDFAKPISKDELYSLFIEIGFEKELFFDDVIYREVLDIRKSVEEYRVICFMMKKK